MQMAITDATFVSKPVFGRECDNFYTALQCVQRQIAARMSSQPVHQHHFGQACLQTAMRWRIALHERAGHRVGGADKAAELIRCC